MPEEWFIDGYNLLHRIQPVSRETLFAKIASFASARSIHVTVVVDGKGSDEEFSAWGTSYFKVTYSQKISADSYIERRLFEKKSAVGAPHTVVLPLVVVTEDRAITNMALGSGARVLKSAAFMELLREEEKSGKNIVFKNQVQAHRFHRPFDEKLKKFIR